MSTWETRSTQDPLQRLDVARATVAAGQRNLFRAIVDCERAEAWRADGSRDMTQWLAGRLGISNWTARRWVAAARALEGLPHIAAALETGTLSVDQVVELTRFATPETEQELIRWARRVSPAAVRRRADLAMRPDLSELREATGGRYLRGWWYHEGRCYGLEGCFPTDQGIVIEQALRRFAARVPESPEDLTYADGSSVPSELRAEMRAADGLFMIASGGLAADPDPERAAVVVHARLDALVGDGGGCEVEGGPVIHPEVATRLACDPRLEVVLHDRADRVAGVGSTSRNPSRRLLRALRHRDRHCTFPGCELARFVHAHHIVRWPQGPTHLDNLVLVCPFHHKLVHEYGWRVELDDAGMARWFRRNGRAYDPTARPRDPSRAPPASERAVTGTGC